VEGTAGVVNLRTGVVVTPDSLFMIQSITKVWTATLVMQLVDDGLVELDVPVRAYLPGFRTADERGSAQITVRHLLTHTPTGLRATSGRRRLRARMPCNASLKIS
jgi:CubicO group peptidase (beta-lactamase class C family)